MVLVNGHRHSVCKFTRDAHISKLHSNAEIIPFRLDYLANSEDEKIISHNYIHYIPKVNLVSANYDNALCSRPFCIFLQSL